jgi:hypothetical protein
MPDTRHGSAGSSLQIYAAYREDDASGAALGLQQELGASSQPIALILAGARPGVRMPTVPSGAVVFLLIGPRWLRRPENAVPNMTSREDPLLNLIGHSLNNGLPIVPVLCGPQLSAWNGICDELPANIGEPLKGLNAVELRLTSFAADLHDLVRNLDDGSDGSGHWTDGAPQTFISVQAERGGALKWYSNRDKVMQVFVDDIEVGVLTGWSGRLTRAVDPGSHTVQVRQGRLNPSSSPLTVHVEEGTCTALKCGRNIFTGGLTLELAG